MQSQSQEKCSQSTPQTTDTENYSLESLKLLYEGAKETQAFFNGPAYAQQMTNTRTYLWLTNLLLSSVFGVLFLFKDELVDNPLVNFVIFGFIVSILLALPCIVLCVLVMRQSSRYIDFCVLIDYYINHREDHFKNDYKAYVHQLKFLLDTYSKQTKYLSKDFHQRGSTLRKLRHLLIFSFLSFILTLVYTIILLYWST